MKKRTFTIILAVLGIAILFFSEAIAQAVGNRLDRPVVLWIGIGLLVCAAILWIIRSGLPPQQEILIPIRPNTDLTLMNLFNAYISLINSERQTIWQRYNIMLLANTFFLGFFRREQVSLTRDEILFGGIFGLVLGIVWLIMTVVAWGAYRRWEWGAAHFAWEHLGRDVNPVQPHQRRRTRDVVYSAALLVIAAFIFVYVILLIDYPISSAVVLGRPIHSPPQNIPFIPTSSE